MSKEEFLNKYNSLVEEAAKISILEDYDCWCMYQDMIHNMLVYGRKKGYVGD